MNAGIRKFASIICAKQECYEHACFADHNQLKRSQSWLLPIIRHSLARRISPAAPPTVTGLSASLADTVEEPERQRFLRCFLAV
jgi:hypothetical protein